MSPHDLLRIALVWAGVSLVLYPVTWVLFLACMSLKRADDAGTLKGAARSMGKVVLATGFVSDFLLNWWFLSVVTLHVAPEWLVTQHLERLMGKPNWQGRYARYLCSTWLNPFDPSGRHCNPPQLT